eukprot:SAG31_NODE_2962_length_4846_cov_3.429956_7_plen_68_part_00
MGIAFKIQFASITAAIGGAAGGRERFVDVLAPRSLVRTVPSSSDLQLRRSDWCMMLSHLSPCLSFKA